MIKKDICSWYVLQLFVVLPALVLTLQGCGLLSASIELHNDTPGSEIVVIETGSEGFVNTGTSVINFKYAISKVNDTSFVMGMRLESEQGVVRCYNHTLDIQWSTTFPLDEDESQPITWYRDGKVTIITELYERNMLTFIGRQFDARDGRLLAKKELAQVSLKKFDDESSYYSMAPDSSRFLIVMNSGVYEENDAHEDMKAFNTLLLTIPHDLSHIQTKEVSVLVQEEHADSDLPTFGIDNQGNVYYPYYDINEKNISFSVVRLSIGDGRFDTLSFVTPVYNYKENWANPGKVLLQPTEDGDILLAWEQTYNDETACISVGRFDFSTHRVPLHTNVTFTKEELEKLIDDDELENIRLLQCMSLPGGDILLVFDQLNVVMKTQISQRAVTSRGANGQINTTYQPTLGSIKSSVRSGPLTVIRIGASGVVQWKNALSTRSDSHLVGASFENYPSLYLTDKSLQLLYRTRSTTEGLTFMEFLLNDGSIHTAKLPVTYSNFALLIPKLTQWSSDNTATFIGSVGEHGRIVRIRLPATEASTK